MSNASPSGIVVAVAAGVVLFAGVLWITGRSDLPRVMPEPAPTPSSLSRSSVSHPEALPFAESAADAPAVSLVEVETVAETNEDALVAQLVEKVRSDPESAARMIETIPPGDLRVAAMRTVFREWAAIAPRDALLWIESMTSEDDRMAAREFVHYRVAEDDPKSALDSAREFGADLATPVVQDLAQQWAARNAPAARDWALSLPAGLDRDRIVSRVAMVLAERDPVAAGGIVSGEIPPGPVQDEAAMSVLHQWAIRDLEGASRWVASFPPGPMRDRAEEELRGIEGHPAGN